MNKIGNVEIKNKIINSNSEIEIMEEEADKEKEIKELKKKINELEFEIAEIKGLVKKNEKHSVFDRIRDVFE